MATVVDGDFEWDDDKAASNLDKHGVSFPEAATVLPIRTLSIWTTALARVAWLSSGRHCENVSYMWCMSNEAIATE